MEFIFFFLDSSSPFTVEERQKCQKLLFLPLFFNIFISSASIALITFEDTNQRLWKFPGESAGMRQKRLKKF